jgi:hypothetical protein
MLRYSKHGGQALAHILRRAQDDSAFVTIPPSPSSPNFSDDG